MGAFSLACAQGLITAALTEGNRYSPECGVDQVALLLEALDADGHYLQQAQLILVPCLCDDTTTPSLRSLRRLLREADSSSSSSVDVKASDAHPPANDDAVVGTPLSEKLWAAMLGTPAAVAIVAVVAWVAVLRNRGGAARVLTAVAV